MRTISAAVLFIVLDLAASSCMAHEASSHKHADLVPIPEYSPPFGAASPAASLRAAQEFLASFDQAARVRLMYDLDSSERAGWSNLPARRVERAGISVGELSDNQRTLLFDFLASSLGEAGYRRVMDAIAAEAFLSDAWTARLRGWSPENYWISFFGTPSASSPWGWHFGGHHLALNMSMEDNRVTSMSPTFVGTDPAIFSYRGVEYEAVIDMQRAGYALYAALETAQKAATDAGVVPDRLRTGPGKDGVIPPEMGLSAADKTEEQKALLLAVVKLWVSIQPSESAERRMTEIKADLDRTRFAWTGTNEVDTPTYMIIRGPSVIIELLSTGGSSRSGEGHIHTVYRNPTMEYGGRGP